MWLSNSLPSSNQHYLTSTLEGLYYSTIQENHIEILFLLWFFTLHQFFAMKNSIPLPNSGYQKRALSCEAVHLRSHAQKAVWIRCTHNDSFSSLYDKHILKRLHSQAPICYITRDTVPQSHTINLPTYKP